MLWLENGFLVLVALTPALMLLLLFSIRRKQMAFADSLATLTADVQKLISESGPAAITAAVAAKDAQDAAAVDALDATVKAALTPPAA